LFSKEEEGDRRNKRKQKESGGQKLKKKAWGNYILPPEVFTHFHFYLQSLKCDTLPPKLSNCDNLTHLTYLFPKYPQ
jgi:hypothetical protein